MKNIWIRQCLVVSMMVVSTGWVLETQVAAQSQGASASQAAASQKIVGFRAPKWKTIHSSSEAEAQSTVATLKKIGCEVETANHGNHIDIKFRCPEWRSMILDTSTLVNQWSLWCETQGMETVVINPPANTRKPTVRYRIQRPKTVHLHDPVKAKQIINTLSLLGCDVKTADHNGHIDTTFHCPQWLTLEVATEDHAHSWQKWLRESGFETQHTHVADASSKIVR